MAYPRHDKAILAAFGRRIRAARLAKDWSQEDLAHEAGLDRTYVGSIERGERNVALLNLNKLARALDDDLADFFPFEPRRGTGRKL